MATFSDQSTGPSDFNVQRIFSFPLAKLDQNLSIQKRLCNDFEPIFWIKGQVIPIKSQCLWVDGMQWPWMNFVD